MRSRHIVLRLIVSGVLLALAVAAPADAAIVQRQRLGGPEGNASCFGWWVEGNHTPAPVYATVLQTRRSIKAVIEFREAPPDTTYLIRVIQGDPDCQTYDAEVTTDSTGAAVVRLHERRDKSQATLIVVVNTKGSFGTYITRPITVGLPPDPLPPNSTNGAGPAA